MLTIILMCFAITSNAQDLTGRWEGIFVDGNIGLRQPSKMVLEVVHIEGKLNGLLELYPVDTRPGDQPNVIFSVEGEWKQGAPRITLILGRVVEGRGGPEFAKFIFEHKAGTDGDKLSGQWYRDHESINTQERGAGTFSMFRTSNTVSDRLKFQKKEKEILKKLSTEEGD